MGVARRTRDERGSGIEAVITENPRYDVTALTYLIPSAGLMIWALHLKPVSRDFKFPRFRRFHQAKSLINTYRV
jgi:hypothetical protein